MQDEPRDGHVCQHNLPEPLLNETIVTEASFDYQKSRRLLNSEQYTIVTRKGKKFFNPLFLVFILPNNQMQSRLGITVSKKTSKRAVDRNRIKRQVREFFRLNQNSWPGCDVIVIANPPAAKKDNTSIQAALKNLWQKAGQYIDK